MEREIHMMSLKDKKDVATVSLKI